MSQSIAAGYYVEAAFLVLIWGSLFGVIAWQYYQARARQASGLFVSPAHLRIYKFLLVGLGFGTVRQMDVHSLWMPFWVYWWTAFIEFSCCSGGWFTFVYYSVAATYAKNMVQFPKWLEAVFAVLIWSCFVISFAIEIIRAVTNKSWWFGITELFGAGACMLCIIVINTAMRSILKDLTKVVKAGEALGQAQTTSKSSTESVALLRKLKRFTIRATLTIFTVFLLLAYWAYGHIEDQEITYPAKDKLADPSTYNSAGFRRSLGGFTFLVCWSFLMTYTWIPIEKATRRKETRSGKSTARPTAGSKGTSGGTSKTTEGTSRGSTNGNTKSFFSRFTKASDPSNQSLFDMGAELAEKKWKADTRVETMAEDAEASDEDEDVDTQAGTKMETKLEIEMMPDEDAE